MWQARELLEDTNHPQEQSVLLRGATATASLEQLERVIQNSVEANIKSGEAFDQAIAQRDLLRENKATNLELRAALDDFEAQGKEGPAPQVRARLATAVARARSSSIVTTNWEFQKAQRLIAEAGECPPSPIELAATTRVVTPT